MIKTMPRASLTKSVLYTLGKLIGSTVELTFNLHRFRSAYARGGRDYAMTLKRTLDQNRIKKKLNDLQRCNFIKIKHSGQKLIISLNSKGKLAILKQQLKQINPSNDLCTVVVFDIPESASSARVQFRRWLKTCDFKMLQRSVWINNRDVADLLNQAIQELRLPGWIVTLTTLTPSVYQQYRKLK